MAQIMENANRQSHGDAAAEIISHQKSDGHQVFEFEDNRPTAATQRKLQDIISGERFPDGAGFGKAGALDGIIPLEAAQTEPNVNLGVTQRHVIGFKSGGDQEEGTRQQLYNAIYKNRELFSFGTSKISNEIKEKLTAQGITETYQGELQKTEWVTAKSVDTEKDEELKRKYGTSTRLGHFASDFLMWNRGNKEAFEGGHLIAHALWDDQDPQVEKADSAENIVGMSRTMNIKSYKDIENQLFNPYGVKNITIDVTYGDDQPTNAAKIADKLGIDVKPQEEQDAESAKVVLTNWVPDNISLSSIKKSSGFYPAEAKEQPWLNPYEGNIDSVANLKGELESHGIWNWIHPVLKQQIEEMDEPMKVEYL
jgi:hypothetical protein